MIQLLLASNNAGKIKEIRRLLQSFDVEVLSLKDLGMEIDVPETGKTFRENAALKAETLARETGRLTLADDSGLEVAALNGEPGIFSARYSGPEKDSGRNIDKLLGKMTDLPDSERAGRFTCVLALSRTGFPTHFAEGHCSGLITHERRGASGFGYDPVFLIPDQGKTFAEMGDLEKNKISHRARALQKLLSHWTEWTSDIQ